MYKKITSTLIIFCVLLLGINTVNAKTFTDVPENTWYYNFVEQLVTDGIIEKTNTFRPDEKQKRQELIKWVIIATNGLASYEEPIIPTFDDVPITSKYYKYIEAAVQMKIIIGYTDNFGNPLAKFGPLDNVTRAEATKILINSFKIPTLLELDSSFSDINKNHWYHDFVITAYNYSILDGYKDDKFGPGDPITKSQMAKLIANAKTPVIRTKPETKSPTTENPNKTESIKKKSTNTTEK